MYKYKIKVKKVSGRLNESLLPNDMVVVKSRKILSYKQLDEKVNDYFMDKYNLVVQDFNVTGFDNDEVAPFYTGNTSSETSFNRPSLKKPAVRRGRRPSVKKVEEEISGPFKVGDILCSSFGYNRTIIRFYKVLRTTKSSVVIRELEKVTVNGDGQWYNSWEVMPVVDKFDKYSKEMIKRIKPTSMHPSVKISTYEYAQLWNGKPMTETSD